MGPFLESVFPDFEKYKAKWRSGELSCVSVFHKYDGPGPWEERIPANKC